MLALVLLLLGDPNVPQEIPKECRVALVKVTAERLGDTDGPVALQARLYTRRHERINVRACAAYLDAMTWGADLNEAAFMEMRGRGFDARVYGTVQGQELRISFGFQQGKRALVTQRRYWK